MFSKKNYDSSKIIHPPEIKSSSSKPHYIFYMDLNGTIMAGDSSNNKGIEDALWQLICENITAKWPLSGDNIISFRHYIENYLCPNSNESSREKLKNDRREWYNKIVSYLESHSPSLAKEIESLFLKLKSMVVDNNVYLDSNGKKCQGNIFPSFLNLIAYLEKNKYSYTIVLSTFGDDLDLVIKELAMRASSLGPFEKVQFEKGQLITASHQSELTSQALETFFKSKKAFAVKHDWKYWSSNGEKNEYGKPFPINSNTSDVIPLFFDDNAIDKQIISVKTMDDSHSNQFAIQQKLRSSKNIVAVNAFNAILNPQYFIEYTQYHNLRLCAPKNFSFLAHESKYSPASSSPKESIYTLK